MVCQYKIEWDDPLTKVLNPEFFNSGSYFELDFSGMKEFIELNALWALIQSGQINVPPCSTGSKVMVTYYTARCGVWVKCSYKVDLSAPVMRDNCYQGPCPSPIPYQGEPYIDVWKWQPCGETCCKKQYELCNEFDPKYNTTVIRIKNVTRQQTPGFQCSEQGNCIDWRTGAPYQ